MPEDLDFDTVRDYIKTDKELSVIDSNTQLPLMTMSKLLKEFGKAVRTTIYNMLLLEFSQTEDRMSKLEDFCAANKFCGFDNLFQGFWSAMWSYAKHCLIPELTDSQAPSLVEMAKIFSEELALKLEEDLKKEE
ncbi:hypothetical protein CAEBREN_12819 [Caenorhabditis brenneri]|uniref:Uncharacterized protein n=1 Tax=Caenorhabditis brenneri TaxID=135651 RepID=G0P159_CAEBE|nr:hypothetical protein CAEBREN_12819 [Caenorhabditis brenneri]